MTLEASQTADQIIETLGLKPHPEGGWYAETWRGDGAARPSGTAIYFLLQANESSHWHKVDATEIWFWHAGAPLELKISVTAEGPASLQVLGPDLTSGRPQIIVPKDAWQSAQTKGAWTLVSCTVSPGFQFEGFTLAEPSFDIPTE